MASVSGLWGGRNKLRPYRTLLIADFYLWLAVADAKHRQRRGARSPFSRARSPPPAPRASSLVFQTPPPPRGWADSP